MADARRIGPPAPKSTPAELRSSPEWQRSLPPDLQRQASMRLGVMSVVGAVLWVVGTALGHIGYETTSSGGRYVFLPFTPWIDVTAIACATVSLGVFGYTRRSRREPGFILDLGLVYMIVMAFGIGLMAHISLMLQRGYGNGQSIQPQLGWIGAIVLMFAAIVPSSPRKTLVAGLIAVAMNPLAMWLTSVHGTMHFGPPINALFMHYPDFLLVGVAVVISRVIGQLGRQVTKAREMGSYELGELIGRGGMGEVYRATHRMLARPAAIKLIRPEMLVGGDGESAELAVKRFYREAETAASLRSPHTVEVYDFGLTEDETLYFVMELLEGMDLESLVRTHGPLPASRVIHIVGQVCDSLGEAHARSLVHRDIKPANIHVGQVGLHRDFVKVLDFGLVKPVRGVEADKTLATVAGLAVGTPAYMPPEMALGEAIDGRSDIYALGCVAYFLLTGQLVFEGNTVQMIAKHMQAQPTPPSQRTSTSVPPALEQAILWCLAKAPNDRPTAAQLARALGAIEVEPWNEEQASRWWSESGLRAESPIG